MTPETNGHTAISEQERRMRAIDATQSRHSAVMEGGQVPPAAQAIQDEYVAGKITSDEMMDRARALVESRVGKGNDNA